MTKRPDTNDRDDPGPKHGPLVPRAEFDPDERDFTPVSDVIERIERTIVLDERDRLLIHLFWQHTANMTMRWSRTDAAQTDARLDALERAVIDMRGERGDNGKIGEQRRRLDKIEARRWWALTFLAGLIVTTLGWAYSFGARIGSIEADVQTLKARVFRVRNDHSVSPDFPATKELP